MELSSSLRKNATITHWQVDGVDVIYPHRHVGNNVRGGIPLCAPLFSVQPRPVLGANLPKHGLLMFDESATVTHDEAARNWTSVTYFPPRPEFVWNFTVITDLELYDYALHHTLIVQRDPTCAAPAEMPLSLCFHPYFATFGSTFTIDIGPERIHSKHIPHDTSLFYTFGTNDKIILTTCKGSIMIETTGYDEYCIWTDNIESYICVEPIYQYRAFGLPGTGLQPGEEFVATCMLTYSPML